MAKTTATQRPEQRTDLAGKLVVVTGGTTGIGRATARKLVKAGARVLIFGRHQKEVDEALAEMKPLGDVRGLAIDVADPRDVRKVFREADAEFGGVDILVNNHATAAKGASVLEDKYDDWHYQVTVNLVGYMACAREAVDRMRKKGAGHLVCVGSMSADLREEGNDVYVATKAGIQAWCESIRKSLNKEKIRVTLVEPGAVHTPLQGHDEARKDKKVEDELMLLSEDIAEAVYFALTQPPRVDVVAVQIRPVGQII